MRAKQPGAWTPAVPVGPFRSEGPREWTDGKQGATIGLEKVYMLYIYRKNIAIT